MGEHAEEAEGLRPTVEARPQFQRKSEEDRAKHDERHGNARWAARRRFDGMAGDEAWALALAIQEATAGNPQVNVRVLEALERLGVRFPTGFKPDNG